MVTGIGTDMIEVERVARACEKHAFFTRCFSIREQKLIGTSWQTAAGNFAVKEAIGKAFGTGVSGFELIDVEVLRDKKGKPYVELHNGAKELASTQHADRIHVSISNTKEYAIAFVVAETEQS